MVEHHVERQWSRNHAARSAWIAGGPIGAPGTLVLPAVQGVFTAEAAISLCRLRALARSAKETAAKLRLATPSFVPLIVKPAAGHSGQIVNHIAMARKIAAALSKSLPHMGEQAAVHCPKCAPAPTFAWIAS